MHFAYFLSLPQFLFFLFFVFNLILFYFIFFLHFTRRQIPFIFSIFTLISAIFVVGKFLVVFGWTMLADCFGPMACSCIKSNDGNTASFSKFALCGKAQCVQPPPNNYYIEMALINANRAASLVVRDVCPGHLDELVAEHLIRKAKNDGRTVSVVNGCLYLDYKFAGFMPMLHV